MMYHRRQRGLEREASYGCYVVVRVVPGLEAEAATRRRRRRRSEVAKIKQRLERLHA